MSDPRWPTRNIRKLTPDQLIEITADRYEASVYRQAGNQRDKWFYLYPEHTPYQIWMLIEDQLEEPE